MSLRLLAAVAVCVLVAASPAAWARKWTSSDGKFSTEADLVELADGQVVLKKTSGETISVPLARLSLADRRFVIAERKPKGATSSPAKTGPSYTGEIQPLLATYCVKCHNKDRAEHGYAADTYGGLTQAGKKGAMVVPGKPAESLLIELFKPVRKHMPPNDAPQPTAEEISKITAWVAAGAEDDAAAPVPEKPEKRKPRR